MTEPEGDSQAISVAELLARNGQRVGAGGGGRRRRGVKGGISVAELTGEFPAVRNGRAAAASDEPVEAADPDAADADGAEQQAAADKVAADKAAADKAAADEKAAAARKAAEDKKAADDKAAAEKKAAEARAAQVDTPTAAAPAVTAALPKQSSDAAATTVIPQVQPLAHSSEPEPKLLAGQSVAGDLLRQGDGASGAGAVSADNVDPDTIDADDELVELAPEPSNTKQWAVLLGQGAVALVAGALMFKGFEKLWDMLPMVGLVLAVLVIVGLVAMVRILRRTDDITSLVIAVVAGVFVTLGPLAFLLSTS